MNITTLAVALVISIAGTLIARTLESRVTLLEMTDSVKAAVKDCDGPVGTSFTFTRWGYSATVTCGIKGE